MKKFFLIVLIIIFVNSQHFLFSQWRETGKLLQGRQGFSAVKLGDGKVLVSGGFKMVGYSQEPLSSCEIYDPELGIWSKAASMNFSRYYHSSLLLPNNKVLVIGGHSTFVNGVVSGSLTSCEIYDPELNIWKLTDSLSLKTYFAYQEAILNPNGKVFLISWAESSSNQACCIVGQIYVYQAEKWSLTDNLKSVDYGFRLSLIGDSVLAIGGMWGVKNCEIFNTSLNSWHLFTQMNEGRANHTATILLNGYILVAGGEDYRGTSLHPKQTCEILNINTLEWNYVAPMIYPRLGHEAVLLKNGEVLVAGGACDLGCMLTETEIYNPVLNKWEYTGDITSHPSGYSYQFSKTLIALNDSSVLLVGLYSPSDSDFTVCNRFFYGLTGIEDNSSRDRLIEYRLFQNYPNPFNPSTIIEYSIPKQSHVTIKVYDLTGRVVSTLVNSEKLAGKYKIKFKGEKLSSGIYFYKIQAGDYSSIKKMVLLK